MEEIISPKYIMKLIEKVEKALWEEYPISKYKNVLFYIKRWHETDNENDINYYWENFPIFYKDSNRKEIDLTSTLHGMPKELVLKIAIDLGIETPDFIPCIPLFKNDLKENYKTAFDSFEKALKQIHQNPDLAVGLANSTLESIIKHIMQNETIQKKINNNKTLYDLTSEILKEFNIFPTNGIQEEIKSIGSGLLKVSQNIEKLRSDKTIFHGKLGEDYIINDSLYAYFIVNSVATIGLFLMSFYKSKYKKEIKKNDEEPRIEDIPF